MLRFLASLTLALSLCPLAEAQNTSLEHAGDIQVTVNALESARNALSPATGSSTYRMTRESIQALPQGDSTPLNQVLLRAPGVVNDSYGQVHVRGDHADLQYRINGILIPEGISGFGQTLDARFADHVNLMTGALPAQYGFRTAGVVDITTKSGAFSNGARTSVDGGSHDTIGGGQEFYGSKGPFNFYVSGSYLQNSLGLEAPTPDADPLHDKTRQHKEFGYFSTLLGTNTRLSVMAGNAVNLFQIPNNPNQPPQFSLNGVPFFSSRNLDQRQTERSSYGVVALQGVVNADFSYQAAYFARTSSVLYMPDQQGDLIFKGIASRDLRKNLTHGVQIDTTWRWHKDHHLRTGGTVQFEDNRSENSSYVFPADANGTQVSDMPLHIQDNHAKRATWSGVYLQDEWRIVAPLTLNYGVRGDVSDSYVYASQISPRAGVVWQASSSTTVHAGYARFFQPPATELIVATSIHKFDGTTGALESDQTDKVTPESTHYFDVGVSQAVGEAVTVGVDGYYKSIRQLLDEGQFGSALIFAPFNFKQGYVEGVELTGDVRQGPFEASLVAAFSHGQAKKVVSGQFNFDQEELDYVASHYANLDHDQAVTAHGEVAYTFWKARIATEALFASGLRNGFANKTHLPSQTVVNVTAGRTFKLGRFGPLDVRVAVVNVLEKVYQIRDGSGIGVEAPQFGARRGFFVGLSKAL